MSFRASFLTRLMMPLALPFSALSQEGSGEAHSLLPNPGFENGLNHWHAPESDRGRSRVDPLAARTGSFGLLVEDRSKTDGSDLFSDKIPAQPGAGYQLSVWANTREGEGLAFYLIFYDESGERLLPSEAFHRQIPSAGEGWTRRVLPAIAPERTASMAVRVHSFNQAQIVAWLDDFDLREVSAAALAPIVNRARPWWLVDAGELPGFPKPEPEKAFPELKLYQPDGSPYRAPREDWTGARQRIDADPAWSEWLARERAQADHWMTHHREHAAWRAGWWHDFVDPADGAFLVWSEDIPSAEDATLNNRAGQPIPVTPKIWGGWVYGFRLRNVNMTQTTARLWRLTGEDRYAEWAASQLDFYAENYLRWSVINGARMGGQSLEEAIWQIRLADAVRLLLPYVAEDRLKRWRDQLFYPQAELLNGSFQAIHNIATWQRAAVAHVALLFDDETMWSLALDGEFGLRAQLGRGVTSDWFWYEQSMGYNDYIMHAMHPLLVFAGLLDRREVLLREAAIVQNLLLAPLTIRFPDHTIPNPSDETNRPRVPSLWLRDGYRVLPTGPGLVSAQVVRSWDTLLDPPAEILAQHPDPTLTFPEVKSKLMESSRFALILKNDWQVFFHFGQLARSHSQGEALNWSASFKGVDVTHDPGTVGYASPLHRDYFTKGLNHNVPLANGHGQLPWQPGDLLEFDPAAGVMSAAQPDYNPDSRARRTLHVTDQGHLVDEAHIALTDPEANGAPLGLVLHLQGTPTLSDAFTLVTPADFQANRPAAFAYWDEVRVATFEDQAELEVELADGLRLLVRFATPGPFKLYHGISPDVPRPSTRSGFYLEKNHPAHEATFTTRLIPR